MGVFADPMMTVSPLSVWVDMDRHAAQVWNVVEQLVADFPRDVVPFGHRQPTRDRHVQHRVNPVSDPSGPYVGDFLDAGHMTGGMRNRLQRVSVHAVQHAEKDRPRRLADHHKDRRGNHKADDGIGERIPTPDANRTDKDRQARPSVNARVVSIGDQCSAADLASDTDAKQGDRFIAHESYDRGGNDRPKQRHSLRMKDPLHRLVYGNQGTRQNRDDDSQASEVLDSAQSIGKSPCHAAPSKPECNAERNRSRRVSKVVNCVREESDAPRRDHNDRLHEGRQEKAYERPFQCPQSALMRCDGWIDHSMRVAMAVSVMAIVVLPVAVGAGIAVFVLVRLFHHISPELFICEAAVNARSDPYTPIPPPITPPYLDPILQPYPFIYTPFALTQEQ